MSGPGGEVRGLVPAQSGGLGRGFGGGGWFRRLGCGGLGCFALIGNRWRRWFDGGCCGDRFCGRSFWGWGDFFDGFAPAPGTIGCQDHGHPPARRHAGKGFNFAQVGQRAADFLKGSKPHISVGHFTATELHGELNLVSLGEELPGFVGFDRQIVDIDLGAQADFFKLAVLAVASGFLFFLFLLVLPLAVVHDPADGWFGSPRYLDQV